MAKNSDYQIELRQSKLDKLHKMEKLLPSYTLPFLDEKELNSQVNTAVSYAYDLHTFFQYLKESNPMLKDTEIRNISSDLLEQLNFQDINDFQKYLAFNNGENKHSNEAKGIARRMSALRGFFEYQCTHGYMKNDPTVGAAKQKREKDHVIVRMNADEVHRLIDVSKDSALSNARQKSFCEKTQLRDTAIFVLLLNTGIRVSELVGLDIEDINFKENSFVVVRKGGGTATLYFNDEVSAALMEYIELERPNYCETDDEKALFLSMQKKRMSIRSVQLMVKKYTKEAVPEKHLTPHKMRSTYGTALYKQSGDIRLVADVLGHKDINTTAKHYAAIEEEHRKQAAKFKPY
ncbi:MAG: tyrosine-type recombinase/integrase [Butyrivibrio sp.]|nr:tyrosine-type recombinase/integrase [Butyrivibrio sp.]